MRWTRRTITAEIKRLYKANEELNYATAEANHLNLVRAAAWHFGTWRHAIEAAGIDYEALSKYRRWNRQRIIERIRELHEEGADLSWRSVSLEVDPPLAAAALRPNGFPSWRDAVTAAGIDINAIARYQYWDNERVIREIKQLHRSGASLSSKAVQDHNQPLFCAARRRFGSWDDALAKAGFNASKIRLRRPATRTRSGYAENEVAATRRSKPALRAKLAPGLATTSNSKVQPKQRTAKKPAATQRVSTSRANLQIASTSADLEKPRRTSSSRTLAKAHTAKSRTQAPKTARQAISAR